MFIEGWQLLQNLYQRSTTTTSRSGSRELKEVNFTSFSTRYDAACVSSSAAAVVPELKSAVLAFLSLSSSRTLFFSVELLSRVTMFQTVPLVLQNTFQRRDTTSSRSSSMELPEDIPHRVPPRHSIDTRHNTSSRHSIDISRAHSVRPPGAAAGQASQLARGSTSSSDNSVWDNVSEENKGIIRQVTNASFAFIPKWHLFPNGNQQRSEANVFRTQQNVDML